MKYIALALLVGISIMPASYAQSKDSCSAEVSALKEENANLKLQLATAKLNMLNNSATPIVTDRQAAIKELEELHPDKVWDERTGALVPKPPPPAASATKPAISPPGK